MKKLVLLLTIFLVGMTAFAQNMKTYQYAERDTLQLYLDFYTPEHVNDSTICLVYVFGGGFIGGHRDGKWEKAYFKQLVDKGFMVASIDYRLGLIGAKNIGVLNTDPVEKAVYMATEDAISALHYLLEHAKELKVNKDYIVMIGSSAGAITALQVDYAMCNGFLNSDILPEDFRLAGVVSYAGAIFSHEGKVQYRKDGQWMDVNFDAAEQTIAPKGTLVLKYEPTKVLENPEYYSHFTISRINEGGTTSLLSFDEGQVDMGGGVSWNNTFKKGMQLDEGTYLLVSGKRMASGKVLATSQIFTIADGQITTLDLQLREPSVEDVTVIGSFDSESKYVKDGAETSVLATTGRGYFIIGVLGVGQEPTNHALRDIAKLKADFEIWGRPVILLFTDDVQQQNYRQDDYGELPMTVSFGVDINHQIQKQIATNMHLSHQDQLPMFIVADTFNRVVFVSQGYTIGLGEQLMEVVKKL